MTANQKKLWEMLPASGEWVNRYEMCMKYGTNGFSLALSFLYKRQLIDLEFRDEFDQWMRRKTIDEIMQLSPSVLKKLKRWC